MKFDNFDDFKIFLINQSFINNMNTKDESYFIFNITNNEYFCNLNFYIDNYKLEKHEIELINIFNNCVSNFSLKMKIDMNKYNELIKNK